MDQSHRRDVERGQGPESYSICSNYMKFKNKQDWSMVGDIRIMVTPHWGGEEGLEDSLLGHSNNVPFLILSLGFTDVFSL